MPDRETLIEAPLLEASGTWGQHQVLTTDPAIKQIESCIYHPWSATQPWGLKPDVPSLEIDTIEDELFYCGYFNCHFGHLLVDTISGLWMLDREKRRKLLFHSSEPPSAWLERSYVKEILDALSLGEEDLLTFDEPVRLSRLRVVEPSMREQVSIHEVFGSFCRDLGRRLGAPDRRGGDGKITYFSRSRLQVGTAKFANEDHLEQLLHQAGVEIVFPESLSVREQVARMHSASCAIGIAGSALHLSAFCGSKAIIGISAGELVNSNFRMIDAVSGNHAVYVYPRRLEVVETPPGFHAAWRYEDPAGVAEALVARAETLLSRTGSDAGGQAPQSSSIGQ